MVIRLGAEVFAVSAGCSHYSTSLSTGLVVGKEIRCPLHHARFDLRTGDVLGPPAFNPISCFHTEIKGDTIFVKDKKSVPIQKLSPKNSPENVVIIGGGAAGNAAAEMLRLEGYSGAVLMIGAEDTIPVDRPNLSKDYLSGAAPEEWIPLRSLDFYKEQKIDLKLSTRVESIQTEKRNVILSDGTSISYGALILATGGDPVRLTIPGGDLPHVHTIRSYADSRAIFQKIPDVKRVVLVGASFIALEVASALLEQKKEVHLVAPEARPLERILGPELGDFIKSLHEEHGAKFHLGHTLQSIQKDSVIFDTGEELPADLVVAGIGVRPVLKLAEDAGLKLDKGVSVNEYLETSIAGIYAAGDIARWPDPYLGENIRVEHWVVAQRQGQVAARNILGRAEKFKAIPFFWSQHYDIAINYVGHAEKWDDLKIYGDLKKRSCAVAYIFSGKTLAVATINRDRESLAIEDAMERNDQKGIQKILDSI